ncbi:MAG: cell division protein FtsA [Fretibacterium sp.]|nr:cell division protein FtsA [Fretibacterium sp.]
MQHRESETLVGLSVGTTKISVIVAEKDPRYLDAVHVIGMGCSPSHGLSKGVIVNINEATQSIIKAFQEAENITDRQIDSAIVAFNALDVKSVMTEGMVALGGRDPKRVEISDLERVIEAAQSRLEISGTMLPVHTIPVRYALDDRVVDEPLNMTGTRLEIMLQTVSVPLTYVKNVITCVQEAGVQVEGLVLKPLAASMGAVTEEETRAGCISISIGGGSTGLVLYQGGRPFRVISIPIGGYHITSDLASVLRVSLRDAEKIKQRIFVDDDDVLLRDGINIDLAIQVIGARVEELFTDYVKVALAECSPQLFPGGVILSGGVSRTPGIVEMLEEILQMQVRPAKPLYAMPPGREDASYASSAGILRYISCRRRDPYLFIEPNLPDVQPVAYGGGSDEPEELQTMAMSRENLRGFLTKMAKNFKDLF